MANKEKLAAAEKARRLADPNSKARLAANTARWRAAHPERAKEVERAGAAVQKAKGWPARARHYQKNCATIIAKASQYAQQPEVAERRNKRQRDRFAADLAYRARITIYRQARRKWRLAGDLTVDQWLGIWAAYDGRCAYCFDLANSMDHVIPRIRGGLHTKDNVVPACKSCNSRKRHRLPFEWLDQREGLEGPNPDILRDGSN